MRKIAQNFVCFSESPNFKHRQLLQQKIWGVSKSTLFWPRFYIMVLDLFFSGRIYFFHILFGLLDCFSLWTFLSLFYLVQFMVHFWFNFFSIILHSLLIIFFIQSRSHFGFLPIFFVKRVVFKTFFVVSDLFPSWSKSKYSNLMDYLISIHVLWSQNLLKDQ